MSAIIGGLTWYLVVCFVRWRIARHYCQSFRLLGPAGLREAWDLLAVLDRRELWLARFAVIASLVGAVSAGLKLDGTI